MKHSHQGTPPPPLHFSTLPTHPRCFCFSRRQAIATGQPLPRFLRPPPGTLEPVKVAVVLKRKINSKGTYYPDLHKVKPEFNILSFSC